MRTIGQWRVVVSLPDRANQLRTVRCKNRELGEVWPRPFKVRGRLQWRALHARNGAVTYHRTMRDAIDDLVRTETTFYEREYL
jgi:hypothetical protein